jgi:hypothetical protein
VTVTRPFDKGRYEYKYAIPITQRDRVVQIAEPFVRPDPHAGELERGGRGYKVHTLYLDTPDLRDYYHRMDQRKIRHRLRIRTYGQAGEQQPVFLEMKRKLENWVVKHRVRICDADQWCGMEHARPWEPLCQAFTPGRGHYTAEHFEREASQHRYGPVTVVHYVREVFVSRRKDQPRLRLTLDFTVSARVADTAHDLYASPTHELLPADWMVLELKYDGDRPQWMRRICKALRLRAVPVSKANLSVAKVLRPEAKREIRFVTPPPVRELGWGL